MIQPPNTFKIRWCDEGDGPGVGGVPNGALTIPGLNIGMRAPAAMALAYGILTAVPSAYVREHRCLENWQTPMLEIPAGKSDAVQSLDDADAREAHAQGLLDMAKRGQHQMGSPGDVQELGEAIDARESDQAIEAQRSLVEHQQQQMLDLWERMRLNYVQCPFCEKQAAELVKKAIDEGHERPVLPPVPVGVCSICSGQACMNCGCRASHPPAQPDPGGEPA